MILRKSSSKNSLCLVLLSGGMDSATVLYWAKRQGYTCQCLLFNYGQRHKKELLAAQILAQRTNSLCHIININLPWNHSSALTNRNLKIPSHEINNIGQGGIPITYVPARNTLFLAYAISAADAYNAQAIALGPNALDYSGYPDCRPNFYKAMRQAALLGTKQGDEGHAVKILTPIIHMSKSEIIKLGHKLNVPWDITWSCYQGRARPCQKCDSCQLRAKGFQEAGIKDPLTKRSRD